MRMIRMRNDSSGTLGRMRPSGRWCLTVSRPTVRSGREGLRVFDDLAEIRGVFSLLPQYVDREAGMCCVVRPPAASLPACPLEPSRGATTQTHGRAALSPLPHPPVHCSVL